MSAKYMSGLVAPVTLTMFAAPAFAQAELALPPAPVEVVESGWNEVSILSDATELEEKLARLYSDAGYRTAIEAMALKDIEDGTIDNKVIADNDLTAYVTFLDSFTNSDITNEVLLGFGGFSLSNSRADTLSENISIITDCREDAYATGQNSQLLKHKYVEGCAIRTLNQDNDSSVPVTLTSDILATYAHVDPRPIEVKLAELQTKTRTPYYNGMKERADALSDNGTTATMYYTNYIQMWNAMLDPDVSWDNLKFLPDNTDSNTEYEFLFNSPSSDTIDNNVEFLFECRSDLLPDDLSQTDMLERDRAFNQIQSCWIEKAEQQHSAWKLNNTNVQLNAEIDPRPLSDKIAEMERSYKSGATYYSKGTRDEAKVWLDREYGTSTMYYTSYIKMWDAMLDPDVSWNDIKLTPDNDDGSNPEFYLSYESDKNLDNNMGFMFECRDEHLPEDLSPTDMDARRDAFNAISVCWTDKVKAQHSAYNADLSAINASPYFSADTTTVAEYRLLNKAFSDVSISEDTLKSAGLIPLDNTTTSLSENFQFVLECRSDHANTGIVINAEDVASCAFEKSSDAFNAFKTEKRKNWISFALGTAAPPLLLIGGIWGVGTYRRKKRDQIKPN